MVRDLFYSSFNKVSLEVLFWDPRSFVLIGFDEIPPVVSRVPLDLSFVVVVISVKKG
jgi:hypothetical protein